MKWVYFNVVGYTYHPKRTIEGAVNKLWPSISYSTVTYFPSNAKKEHLGLFIASSDENNLRKKTKH